ncbi:hypothetical protein ACQAYK_08955 [Acidithiobacillus sp. AC3]
MNQNANPQPTAWVSAKSQRAKIMLAVFFLFPFLMIGLDMVFKASTGLGENVTWLAIAGGLALLARQLL